MFTIRRKISEPKLQWFFKYNHLNSTRDWQLSISRLREVNAMREFTSHVWMLFYALVRCVVIQNSQFTYRRLYKSRTSEVPLLLLVLPSGTAHIGYQELIFQTPHVECSIQLYYWSHFPSTVALNSDVKLRCFSR